MPQTMAFDSFWRASFAITILLVGIGLIFWVGGAWAGGIGLTTALLMLPLGWRNLALKGRHPPLSSGAGAPPPPSFPPVLPASTAEAAMVIEALSDPAVIVAGGRIIEANGAARQLLGDHIVGEDARLAFRQPGAAERLAAGGLDGTVQLTGVGGRSRRGELRIASIAPGVRLVHLVDRSAAYAIEQARVDFVANASHELRTPLATLLGFIETLQDDCAGNDAALRSRFLNVMMKEASRMQRLVEDLLSLSRIEADKFRLPSGRVRLDLLIRRITTEMADMEAIHARSSAPATPPKGHKARVIALLPDDPPSITGDDGQLSQLLYNLIDNARKYSPPERPVTVTLSAIGNTQVISVADEGEGIAAEHLPRLTERFYRVDPGRSRAIGGTGLGLAIVKHIVERHRGTLDIASAPGQGTTVTVRLPVSLSAAPTDLLYPDVDAIVAKMS